jgi:hypothetical protein
MASDLANPRLFGEALEPLTRPVRDQLGSAVTRIDDRNVGLLVKAILHASGQRRFSR